MHLSFVSQYTLTFISLLLYIQSHAARWLPGVIYSALCIVVIFLFAFVPETNGVELPQTIEELGEWYKVNTFELKIGKNRHAKEKKDTKDGIHNEGRNGDVHESKDRDNQ